MDVILARHGNTFGPGDRPVRAGSGEDLELTGAGLEQAKALAGFIRKNEPGPAAVYCGPLKRTKIFAEIIAGELEAKTAPIVDDRLNELDYGRWAGLTDEEIAAMYKPEAGPDELSAWNRRSVWPPGAGFSPPEDTVISQVREISRELVTSYKPEASVLLVSSNGKLRYFLKLVEGAFEDYAERGLFKVKTGHVCKLRFEDGRFEIIYWNKNPVD